MFYRYQSKTRHQNISDAYLVFYINLDSFSFSIRLRKSSTNLLRDFTDYTPLGNANIAWHIAPSQAKYISLLSILIVLGKNSVPIQNNGDRFRDTCGRFRRHERRTRSLSFTFGWHGTSDRQTNPPSIQYCWICLLEESWNLTG